MAPGKTKIPLILKKGDIAPFIEKLIQILTVYGPVAKKTQFVFDEITNGTELRLDYDTTILPPKKYFIPPKEEMVRFSLSPQLTITNPLEETEEEPLWNGKRFVIFGIHSCDLAAIRFHDEILTQIYPDPYRAHRREEGIIIGLNCLTPCENSFCKSAGTLSHTEGADLMLTELDDVLYVDVFTETGRLIVDHCKGLFSSASKEKTKRVDQILSKRENTFPDVIAEFEKLPDQMQASYEGEMWSRLGRRCFGCGACTLVCPTCFCFDVKDRVELDLNEGSRVRKWDSCQLVDFALVAGGHNFRPTIPSRVRFRIYHKFWIEPDQIKQIGCVGCGRCTRTCPADIDMIELLADIQKGGNQ
jgi:formate hydrogenlyase subunit 6/NADH:ubiquinone oxidoreductase subunit I